MLKYTLIAAAFAVSAGLSTAAFAENPAKGSGMPANWDGAIGNTFFSDPAGMKMHSDETIQSNWTSLTAEQQAQVRTDCETMGVKAQTGADSNRTGGGAEMDKVCAWVKTTM